MRGEQTNVMEQCFHLLLSFYFFSACLHNYGFLYLTFHRLGAVNEYILSVSDKGSSPPQVKVVNLTPLISGKLNRQGGRRHQQKQVRPQCSHVFIVCNFAST